MAARLLLVDDDTNILETAIDILEDAGFLVHTAADAATALHLCQTETMNLVISDYNLPDMSGADLARAIRRTHPSTHVILMSGQQDLDPATVKDAVDTVLLKPVDPGTLLGLIKRTLDE